MLHFPSSINWNFPLRNWIINYNYYWQKWPRGMKALIFFKNQTPRVCLKKKKMLETEVSISLLLSTDGKRTVKKSYPQQIISC